MPFKKIVKVSPFLPKAISFPEIGANQGDTNPKGAQENTMEKYIKQSPFQICKPLVVTMASFGLLHLTHEKWTSRKWISTFSKGYSVVVLVLLWLNIFRFFSIYSLKDSFGPILFLKIIVHLWYLIGTTNCTVNFKACGHDNRLREFLAKWLDLMKTNRSSTADVGEEQSDLSYTKSMSRRVFTFLLIGWIIFILNNVFSGYLLFATPLLDISISPMQPDHRFAFVVRCIAFVFHIYLNASWVFTLCLYFLICSVVYKEFEIFQQEFRAAISADSELHCGIEIFRRRHQSICRIVETADDTLSVFNIAGIGFSMCIGMLELYVIVWYDVILSDPFVLLTSIFWLTTSFAYIVVIAFGGGYLNHVAHAPLKSFHDIEVVQTSPEFSLQMNMFLNKLTGESIGLTAMDLFVIDKPTILTIAGAFITYFIVLIQFQQPNGSTDSSSVFNCRDILLNSTLQCSIVM